MMMMTTKISFIGFMLTTNMITVNPKSFSLGRKKVFFCENDIMMMVMMTTIISLIRFILNPKSYSVGKKNFFVGMIS